MTFKNLIVRLKRNLLCDKRERKPSLDIGEPTNVRVIDVSDSLPGLTDAQRKQIREEASSGALRLQSIQSQPPTSPPSPSKSDTRHPSVDTNTVESPSTNTEIISHYSFSDISPEEPTMAPFSTISQKLPSSVLTSPRRKQKDYDPPATHMKSMWNSERPYRSDSSGEEDISHSSFSYETGLKDKKLGADSPHTLSLDEGDQVQDGAHGTKGAKEESSTDAEKAAVRRAEKDVEVEHNCDSAGVDSFTARVKGPLVAC